MRMRRRLAWLPILAAIALTPAAAGADTGEAPMHKSGAAQGIGDYVAELELTGTELTLRVSDGSRRPVDTAEMSATAIAVAKDGRRKSVALKPAGENRLAGTIKFEPPDLGMRAIVMLTAHSVEVGRAIYDLAATP
jgi:hypothetical protein